MLCIWTFELQSHSKPLHKTATTFHEPADQISSINFAMLSMSLLQNLRSRSSSHTMTKGSPFATCMCRAQEQRQRAAVAVEARARARAQASQNAESAATPSSQIKQTHTNQLLSSLLNNQHVNQRTQHVWTIAKRARVMKWMKEAAQSEVESHIAYKAVKQLPILFRTSTNANYVEQSCCGKKVTNMTKKLVQLVDSVYIYALNGKLLAAWSKCD